MINLRNQYGCTALHFAVAENVVDIVKMLLAHGGDSNAKEVANGRTILHVAARVGKKCVFKYLVREHGMSLLVSTLIYRIRRSKGRHYFYSLIH